MSRYIILFISKFISYILHLILLYLPRYLFDCKTLKHILISSGSISISLIFAEQHGFKTGVDLIFALFTCPAMQTFPAWEDSIRLHFRFSVLKCPFFPIPFDQRDRMAFSILAPLPSAYGCSTVRNQHSLSSQYSVVALSRRWSYLSSVHLPRSPQDHLIVLLDLLFLRVEAFRSHSN